MANQVKAEHVVIDLISVVIEAPKDIDLIVPAICHRGVDEACRPLTQGADDTWSVSLGHFLSRIF